MRQPHFVDSRFGLYHVAVMLSFLRSPALQKFECNLEGFFLEKERKNRDPGETLGVKHSRKKKQKKKTK